MSSHLWTAFLTVSDGEGVTPPRQRKDKGLGRVLAVVVAVPVLLVAIAVGGYLLQPKSVSASGLRTSR